MGARISVDEIETGSHSISWCVIEMCSPWLDGTQDENDFNVIPSTVLKAADEAVPRTEEDYARWRKMRTVEWSEGQGRLWLIERNGEWPSQIFAPAREFLREYVQSGSNEDAYVDL
jgi:hypothetical protein